MAKDSCTLLVQELVLKEVKVLKITIVDELIDSPVFISSKPVAKLVV